MRKLQHIGFLDEMQEAKREGQKVTALCGARNYPMMEMKDEIAMCTPCAKELLRRYNRSRSWTFKVRVNESRAGGAA